MAKKKKNRRNSAKYPGLKPEFNLRTRSDLIDQEYSSILPDKKVKHCSNVNKDCKICSDPATRYVNPKEWLNKFNEEFVNAKLDSKRLKNNLHNTKELKKDCYDRNNSRNRDILTQQKASGRLMDYEKIKEMDILVDSPEDQMLLKEALKEAKKRKKIIS